MQRKKSGRNKTAVDEILQFSKYLESQIAFGGVYFTPRDMPKARSDYQSLEYKDFPELFSTFDDVNIKFDNPFAIFSYKGTGMSASSTSRQFGISIIQQKREKMIYSVGEQGKRDEMVKVIERYWGLYRVEKNNQAQPIKQNYYYKMIDVEKHSFKPGRVYFYYNWRSLFGNDAWEETTDGFFTRTFKKGISILTPIVIKHFFICAGDNLVIHFTGNTGDDAGIRQESLMSILQTTGTGLFAGEDKKHWIFKLQVVKDKKQDKEIKYNDCLVRANRLKEVGFQYNPIHSNCEHFAKFCLFGKRAGILHNQAADKIMQQLKQASLYCLGLFPLLERIVRVLLPAATVIVGPMVDIFICLFELASRLFSFLQQLFRLGKFPSFKQLQEILKNVFRFNVINILIACVVLAVAITLIAAPAISVPLAIVGIVLGVIWVLFRFLKPYCHRVVHMIENRVLGSPSLEKIASWSPFHLMLYIIQKAEEMGQNIAKEVRKALAMADMQLSVEKHVLKKKTPEFPNEISCTAAQIITQILADLAKKTKQL